MKKTPKLIIFFKGISNKIITLLVVFLISLLNFFTMVIPFKDIEDIYFFEVNTKYISSSAVKKISIFYECAARVKMLIFSPQEMKYIWYFPKKVNFLFI